MRAKLGLNGCSLYRDTTDKRIPKESTVVYHMKRLLNEQGYNFVRMYPDRHGLTSCRLGLVDWKRGIGLWHERYAIESANGAFNQDGEVFFLRAEMKKG